MGEIEEYLLSIGFKNEGRCSTLVDDEKTLERYIFMSEKDRSFKFQEYTHSLMRSPESGRTMIWTYKGGTRFHGYTRSVQDIKDVFRLLKK